MSEDKTKKLSEKKITNVEGLPQSEVNQILFEQLNDLAMALFKMNERFDHMEARFDRLEARFDNVQNVLDVHSSDIASIRGNERAIFKRFDRLETR